MMTFAGHIGISLIVAFFLNLNPLLTLIGGVLPDLDILLFFLGKSWNKAHRKLSHSLLVPVVLLILSLFFPILLPVLIGVIVHLFADMDSWGVPLFYPFVKREFSFFKMNHETGLNHPIDYIKVWFKNRGRKFYLEWALLVIGLILTWDYWIKLIVSVIQLS